MAKLHPYQIAMGIAPQPRKDGPLEGEALEAYVAEVNARIMIRLSNEMDKAMHGGGMKFENCDGFDPFEW